MQMVLLEKALGGCCPGISAAVACFRTCWELKLARRKGLWTKPCQALFCPLGSWGEVGLAVSLRASSRPLCPHLGTLCEKISRILITPAFSEMDRLQKKLTKQNLGVCCRLLFLSWSEAESDVKTASCLRAGMASSYLFCSAPQPSTSPLKPPEQGHGSN